MSANSRRHTKAHRLALQAKRQARAVTATRVGGPVLDRLEPGVLYRLRDAIETRCDCGAVLQPGEYVIVERFTSPNRVLVTHGESLRAAPSEFGPIDGSVHKIRASSLRACADLVLQPERGTP